MYAAFMAVAKGIWQTGHKSTRSSGGESDEAARKDRDLPGTFIFAAIAIVVLVRAQCPASWAEISAWFRECCVRPASPFSDCFSSR